MTGEITLRGLVLPVGGIKEKVLAAHRAGIKRVIMPARNEKDLIDVPEQARKELEFVFATHMDDVLGAALEENPVGRKAPTPPPPEGGAKPPKSGPEPAGEGPPSGGSYPDIRVIVLRAITRIAVSRSGGEWLDSPDRPLRAPRAGGNRWNVGRLPRSRHVRSTARSRSRSSTRTSPPGRVAGPVLPGGQGRGPPLPPGHRGDLRLLRRRHRGELARHRVRPRPDAARLRRRGGIPAARSAVRSSGVALADALAHAHAAGVIHRDLKPENVMIAEFGGRPAVKLADFGIARILSQDDRMTMTGAMVGSPNHMAPEIVDGEEADERSDVFSLGTILYWLCTGRLPFEAPNPSATLRRLVTGDFPDPRSVNRALGEPLARLIASCLALDPAARPAGAAQVRDALAAILRDDGIDRPDETLTAFLADPQGTAEALRPRIVEARLRRGEEHLARGEIGARPRLPSTGSWPSNPDIPPCSRSSTRWRRSDRRRRLLRRGAVGPGGARRGGRWP